MFCSKCGAELEAGVKFCYKCGTPTIRETESIVIGDDKEHGKNC